MTFSIIVPVYNVEKYLPKCLDSLLGQNYQDFEIIVVNDGSPDDSQSIIDEYSAQYPEKIKAFVKENGGLSDARNFGISRAKGDYMLFVDSDDYVVPNMLAELKATIDLGRPDVVGFKLIAVDEEGKLVNVTTRPSIKELPGEEALIALVDHKVIFESACGYAYRREFWNDNDFSFIKGIYHEDFALLPLIIFRAKKVSCIDFDAYYYICREGSITHTQTAERAQRLAQDLLKGFDYLINELHQKPVQNEYAAQMYMAYIANALIFRLNVLEGELKAWFRKELKVRGVHQYILADTLKRKIRKMLIRLQCGI